MSGQRTISVGLSRLFRLVEVHGDAGTVYRVEQAVKELKKWKWVPLATATRWNEAHGALHQMQADFTDRMIERQGSFRGDKTF